MSRVIFNQSAIWVAFSTNQLHGVAASSNQLRWVAASTNQLQGWFFKPISSVGRLYI